MGDSTALTAITTHLPLSSYLTYELCKVIQSRSNWVQAPLAHLRSAGEVATNTAITLEADEGVPSSVIAGVLSLATRYTWLGYWLIMTSACLQTYD